MSLSVRPFDDLVYEDRYNDDEDDTFDSDDSNDENHAGNEYPDEDDDAALNSDRENDDEDAIVDTRNISFLLENVALGKFYTPFCLINSQNTPNIVAFWLNR